MADTQKINGYWVKDATARTDIASEVATRKSQVSALERIIEKGLGRQIRNLDAASRGILYLEDVDTDNAYSKEVQPKVLPLASVDMVGGNTIKTKNLLYDELADSTISAAGKIGAGSGYKLGFAQIVAGKTYTISCDSTASTQYVLGYYSSAPSAGSTSYDGQRYIVGMLRTPYTFTAPITGYVAARFTSATQSCQIEEGSTATAYEPYFAGLLNAGVVNIKSMNSSDVELGNLPIPQAARDLCPCYGASAGTAYNYIDWARRVYVQNVGSVTKTSVVRVFRAYGDFTQFYLWDTIASKPEGIANIQYTQTTLSVSSNVQPLNTLDSYSEFISVHVLSSTSWGIVSLPSSVAPDLASANAYLASNPITINYKLETPVEVDLSSVLTDENFIEVEAGGTLTFENSHGSSYRIPVPNTETFEIDVNQ